MWGLGESWGEAREAGKVNTSGASQSPSRRKLSCYGFVEHARGPAGKGAWIASRLEADLRTNRVGSVLVCMVDALGMRPGPL